LSASGPVGRDPGTGAGGDGDEALVEALGRQARRLAAEDDHGGPPPAAWYRLARARRARGLRLEERRGSRGAPVIVAALVAGAACVLAVGLAAVHWRRASRGDEALASRAEVAPGAVASPAAPPLSFSVRGATVTRGEEIDVVGSSDAAVRFSDGTDVGLDVGARLAVTARDAHGARLRLQSGRARFQVVHRPNAAWTVDAGPYRIEVTGTVFAVRWSEADQTIAIAMESGSVRVSGPLLSERMSLRTGQRLVVRSTTGDVQIEERRPADAPEGAPAPTEAVMAPAADRGAAEPKHPEPLTNHRRPRGELALASPRSSGAAPPGTGPSSDGAGAPGDRGAPDQGNGRVPPVAAPLAQPPPFQPPGPSDRGEPAPVDSPPGAREETGDAAGRPRTGWASRRWPARVATGDSQAVLAEAEQIGFEATLAGAEGADLSAFADAARYAGRPDLADRALLETRRRFPGSARAQAAAFLLGRAADDRGDTAAGLAWFRRYLMDAPHGPFASEALGRQMIAVEKLGGRAAAAPLAAEYLRRFSNGTYLLRARALLGDR